MIDETLRKEMTEAFHEGRHQNALDISKIVDAQVVEEMKKLLKKKKKCVSKKKKLKRLVENYKNRSIDNEF